MLRKMGSPGRFPREKFMWSDSCINGIFVAVMGRVAKLFPLVIDSYLFTANLLEVVSTHYLHFFTFHSFFNLPSTSTNIDNDPLSGEIQSRPFCLYFPYNFGKCWWPLIHAILSYLDFLNTVPNSFPVITFLGFLSQPDSKTLELPRFLH